MCVWGGGESSVKTKATSKRERNTKRVFLQIRKANFKKVSNVIFTCIALHSFTLI